MKDTVIHYRTTITSLDYINYVVIPVPHDILLQLAEKDSNPYQQRLIVRVDDKVEWQGGTLAMGEGDGCITINSAKLKKLGKSEGNEVDVKLRRDDSKYGVQVPDELEQYWEVEPEAFRRFELLNPSLQRYILNHIGGVKASEKRLQRAIATMEALIAVPEGQEKYANVIRK